MAGGASVAVATGKKGGKKRWLFVGSRPGTSTLSRLRARAAYKPPNPPPMMTTRGRRPSLTHVVITTPRGSSRLRQRGRHPAVRADEIQEDARRARHACRQLTEKRQRHVDVRTLSHRRDEQRILVGCFSRLVHLQHPLVLGFARRRHAGGARRPPAPAIGPPH